MVTPMERQVFLQCVQALAIVNDVKRGRSIAAQVIWNAACVAQEMLPGYIARAAEEFVGWQYGDNRRPEWA